MPAPGSTLAEHGATLDPATRDSLARSVETKAREMSELVSNVLDLMRFESGQIALRRDWQTLDDLVGRRCSELEERLVAHPIELHIPADLPPVYVDATLIVQVLRQSVRQRRQVHTSGHAILLFPRSLTARSCA